MGVYSLRRTQHVKGELENVWRFFSNPANLVKITPPDMNFTVTSPPEDRIYPGQVITYKVSPVLNIPMTWMTEITQVVEQKMFIDEQKYGPYRIWHHQHFFEQDGDGVLMTDIVHYKPPMMIFGDIANTIFIKKKLNSIFDYRQKVINNTSF